MKLSSKDFKDKITEEVFNSLKEIGFKKNGLNFSLTNNDLIYFIQIQNSQSSASNIFKFTINTAICSILICKFLEVEKPTYLDSHWFKRIGFYQDIPSDKWWTITDLKSAHLASNEISELLKNRVLPNFYLFKTTSDLKTFWRNGNFEGLTKKQQEYYLALLDKSI